MPGSHPGEGVRPGKPYEGLCVFDMDNTLTRDMLSTSKTCGVKAPDRPSWSLPPHGILPVQQYPAVYASKAIQKCQKYGFAVGVATAAPCQPPPALGDPGGKMAKSSLHTRMNFLRDIGMPPNVVTAKGKQGPAYQCIDVGGPDGRLKSRMVGNLMQYYGVPPNKTVFFDDQSKFLDEVKSVHPKVTTQLASSRECHGKVCLTACGLRKEEFQRGVGTVMVASNPAGAKKLYNTLAGNKEKGKGHVGVAEPAPGAPSKRAVQHHRVDPLRGVKGTSATTIGAQTAAGRMMGGHHHTKHALH